MKKYMHKFLRISERTAEAVSERGAGITFEAIPGKMSERILEGYSMGIARKLF